MAITITHKKNRNMGGRWVYGTHSNGMEFQALVFEEPSSYGIQTEQYLQGNNVSKLYISNKAGREIFIFDQGFDVPYSADAEPIWREIARTLERRFCREPIND